MSEKDKKSKQAPEENAAAEQPVNETPEAAAEAAPETYTVTKEQMQQMERTTPTASGRRGRRSICTATPRSTPSSRFWRCWTTWSGA